MIAEKQLDGAADNPCGASRSATEETSGGKLDHLHHALLRVRVEMRDLADWMSGPGADGPPRSEMMLAAQATMDSLTDQAASICDAMIGISSTSLQELKRKAYVLEYLLPEDEDDLHVALCKSVCSDIRCL